VIKQLVSSLFCLALLGGCSAKVKQQIDFSPSEPLRVAILPFYQEEKGKLVSGSFDPNIFVDNIPLLSSKLKESPPALVQGVVETELKSSGLDLISPGYVNAQLGHHGFVIESKVAIDRLLEVEPSRLGEFLGADALLYGKIKRWDRLYFGIQSSVSVSIELKLVRTRDSKTIFFAEGNDTDARGITGIPTGFSAIVIEPLRGLDNENIVNLSQKLVKKMLAGLSVKERPEYLNSEGPVIFGAVHNGKFGVSGERPLQVLLIGSPGKEGYFALGNYVGRVPMVEIESGKYLGRYFPLEGERAKDLSVVVTLKDSFGRSSEKSLVGKVSLLGE
jgi:Putative bacterial lipoprotein (DUF799)